MRRAVAAGSLAALLLAIMAFGLVGGATAASRPKPSSPPGATATPAPTKVPATIVTQATCGYDPNLGTNGQYYVSLAWTGTDPASGTMSPNSGPETTVQSFTTSRTEKSSNTKTVIYGPFTNSVTSFSLALYDGKGTLLNTATSDACPI